LALQVRADGTLDLQPSYTPKPQVDYQFVWTIPRPDDAPPVGAGGGNQAFYESITIALYEPNTTRSVMREGALGILRRYNYTNQGMVRDMEVVTDNTFLTPAPAPTCTLARLWAIAIDQGAPLLARGREGASQLGAE